MHQFVIKIKPQSLLIVILVIFALALTLLMLASGDRMQPALSKTYPLVNVEATRLTLQPAFLEKRHIIAQVEHINVSNIGFDMSGTLTQLFADEGQQVKKGQILAKLDTSRLQADRLQLQASLTRKKAEAELGRLTTTRVAALAKQNLASKQASDESRLAFSAAKASVLETEAIIARLDVELDKAILIAPFDGMVQKRHSALGAVLSAGQPLFKIQETAGLRVRMALSSADRQAFVNGQKIALFKNDRVIPAYIEAIIENKTSETQTQDVILRLSDNLSDLVAGDTLTFTFSREVKISGSWVPRSALSAGVRGMWQVMTVVASEHSFLVQPLLVNIEYFDAERAFISGVLTEDTQIVTGGRHKIQPHQRVSVQTPMPTIQSIEVNSLGANHE